MTFDVAARLGGTPYGAYDVRAEEDAGENDPGVKENAENIRAYIKEKVLSDTCISP
jgi:hypothetical protein